MHQSTSAPETAYGGKQHIRLLLRQCGHTAGGDKFESGRWRPLLGDQPLETEPGPISVRLLVESSFACYVTIVTINLLTGFKIMRVTLSRLLLLSFCLLPTAASAHIGWGDTHGIAHGFLHPLSGVDHVLAMITIGLLAYQLGGRAIKLVPATFVVVMAIGGSLGVAGLPLPFTEAAIALSVVVFGAIVAAGVRTPIAIAMGIAGLFAVFHGHAHGTEMPLDQPGTAYALGFIMGTASLHALGIGLGFLIGLFADSFAKTAMRITGGLVALAGFLLLTGNFA